MFFLMLDLESQTREEIFGLLGLGDEKRIKILFLKQFLDFLAPSFIIEKRMFRIDIDIDRPAVRNLFQRLEYFVQAMFFEEKQLHREGTGNL